jgi:hypothetical protein
MHEQYKGMRIVFFEEIYEKYSQLDFTHYTDRAVGMAGIETRLAKLFGLAQYGLLYDPNEFSYLPRTLLWQRADMKDVLKKINYPEDKRVPSWSWMAVMGRICFMGIPFAAVRWREDFEAPFGNLHGHQDAGELGKPPQALQCNARDFSRKADDRLIFDQSEEALPNARLKCLVLGTDTNPVGRVEKHYGLLLAATGVTDSYERVGVATFERDKTWIDIPGTPVRVV